MDQLVLPDQRKLRQVDEDQGEEQEQRRRQPVVELPLLVLGQLALRLLHRADRRPDHPPQGERVEQQPAHHLIEKLVERFDELEEIHARLPRHPHGGRATVKGKP